MSHAFIPPDARSTLRLFARSTEIPGPSLLTLLTLFSRSTEIPGPSLLTLFARSTEIPVKAGASQLGKKHPARLLGRHTLGKLGWRPSERTDAGVPELGRSI